MGTTTALRARRPWASPATRVSHNTPSHRIYTYPISPVVVGTLTGIAFTLLLFFSSFITTYLISGPTNESYFFYYPWDSVRDVIRTTVCVLTEGSCDDDALPGRLSKLRMPTPSGPPTLLGRFLRRLLLGLPTVGAGSMINIIYSMPFPIAHWIRVRLRRQNRNSTDFTALLVMTVILIGAAKYATSFRLLCTLAELWMQGTNAGIPAHRKGRTASPAPRRGRHRGGLIVICHSFNTTIGLCYMYIYND